MRKFISLFMRLNSIPHLHIHFHSLIKNCKIPLDPNAQANDEKVIEAPSEIEIKIHKHEINAECL
jgi:hypothetical protein